MGYVNGEYSKLSDYTQHLPRRVECGEIQNSLHDMKRHGYKWNKHHYHLIDHIFTHSGMGAAYTAFMNVLSEKAGKDFRGDMLNKMTVIMLVHLEDPMRCGYTHEDGIKPIIYSLSVVRACFLRRFVGDRTRYEPLKKQRECTANLKRCSFKKSEMVRHAKYLMDDIENRAKSYQKKFRATNYYKENYPERFIEYEKIRLEEEEINPKRKRKFKVKQTTTVQEDKDKASNQFRSRWIGKPLTE